MHNLNSKEECELKTGKPRIIKKFEKRPPLKVSNKAQPSKMTSSMFKDKMNVPTPVEEVTHSKNDVHYEKNLLKNESNVLADSLNNLSSTQDKYEFSNGTTSNRPNGNTMPANQRLSTLMNRLKQLQVTPNKISQEEVNLQNNLSTNKIENNEKSSCLNNKLSSKLSATNGASSQMNGSQNLVKDNNWDLSKQIWTADQVSLENNRLKESDKFLQANINGSVPDKNGPSLESSWRTGEKENNLFKASQSQQHTGETQFTQQAASQYDNNSTSAPLKKSRMSMLLEKLRSEAHSEQSSPTDSSPPPKLSPSKASSRTFSSPSSPCKSKSPSYTASPASRAASTSSHSSSDRPRATCYNCGLDDHKHFKCPRPLIREFCYRCGWEDVTSDSCPFCTGTLIRPGSTRPVPVGGDARKKFASVDLDRTREEYKMKEERKKSRKMKF